ncbi:MAG: response regulator transcription factor [Bacteroidota bacterium]|jgi:two-component system alkaline phosphatase synthesis response regulator PhoP
MKTSSHILFCVNKINQVSDSVAFLKTKNYSVFLVHTEKEFYERIYSNNIDIIVSELDFEKKDAISITNEIRALQDIIQPNIIVLSYKNDDYIQVSALNAGADDYINLPIKPSVLEARIKSFVKRRNDLFGSIAIDFKNSQSKFFVDREQYVIITESGNISLPKKEFEMVNLMYESPGKIFTRVDFAKIIWDSPDVAKSRTIDIHVRNIRKLLGDDAIKTSKGIGYSLNI